jgi:hypothetical protein
VNISLELQLVNISLELLDIICNSFHQAAGTHLGFFIECKTSVSAPCLASITKGFMRLKALTRFDCGKQFQLDKFYYT